MELVLLYVPVYRDVEGGVVTDTERDKIRKRDIICVHIQFYIILSSHY